MSRNHVESIRQTIAKAKEYEAESGTLRKYLKLQIPDLHTAIRLPSERAEESMLLFATQYIEQIPDFVEAITDITQKANVYTYAQNFLDIATDFFINPPDIVDHQRGLGELLDEAYLAHRFIEEINDRFIGYCGAPLSPMDMTIANIVIHDLIGEPYANQLDTAVQFALEMHNTQEDVFKGDAFLSYLTNAQKKGWETEMDQWPCLAKDLSISLELGIPASQASHH